MKRRTFPRAKGKWALDSGGYSELSLYGSWSITPDEYIVECRRYQEEIGNLCWAASMDWMCEPWVIGKTGLTVSVHQERTIDNYLTLMMKAPDIPWTPVLQGWSIPDYLRHLQQYDRRGIDLCRCSVVGLGSVCRRQHTSEVEKLIRQLQPLRLHGFGFKIKGLQRVSDVLFSADSMAWSMEARYKKPLPGHTHKNCANCLEYALRWRERIVTILRTGVKETFFQPSLFEGEA